MTSGALPESLRVTLRVVRTFEKLGVRYAIGGSVATAIHGLVRSTMDVDIVAALDEEHVPALVGELGSDFYFSEPAIRDAIRRGGTFNIIALEPMFKVDIFVSKGKPFETSQLDRSKELVVSEAPEERAFVSTAEDNVLAKLIWYRKGGEVSDRQWQDVLGVLRVQGSGVDRAYLLRMAAVTGVGDLLEQALSEASGSPR